MPGSYRDGTVRQPAHRRAVVRPRRGPRVLAAVAVTLVLLVGLVVLTGLSLMNRIGDNVTRVPDAFAGLDDAGRPAADGGLTFLIVGTDTRSTVPTTGTDAAPDADAGSQRSDVLMVARLAADGRSAAVVSIPRDSWVDIPGRGQNKINAAYAFGGPSLLIQTVEELTALRVDHFAVVDFAGFRSVVDAVGGIDVDVAADTSNDGVAFRRGVNHLDGVAALAYVRQRYGLADGDLDRAQRQQNALRAVLDRVASGGTVNDPSRLYTFLAATSRSVSVDDTLDNTGLRDLALRLRPLSSGGTVFLRAPVAGLGREGEQSVVRLDGTESARLWDALRGDTVPAYAQSHAADTLGSTTR